MILDRLNPNSVWSIFEEICKVPRPSKKEEKIMQYLLDFGKKNNLETKRDEIGNVLIKKSAYPGMEHLPTVVLQSHMDMVCEKNSDVEHDFDKDPIVPYIDGEWVKAKGTTLGADDGIGVAAELALLISKDIKHGAIECLFTVDEETGLSGAFALQPGFFDGKILLNLDSEDEGEMFIGCAGGIDTVITVPYDYKNIDGNKFAFNISVKGLLGGHSGDDINKGRANAIKILNRFIWESRQKFGADLAKFEGGNLRNAIAREANALLVVNNEDKEQLMANFNIYHSEMKNVWSVNEPELKMDIESIDVPKQVLSDNLTDKLLNSLYACPHGVFSMSYKMPGMVETSTNLAAIKFKDNNILITTSQRSDVDSEKMNIANMVACSFRELGANIEHGEGYPGWAPNTDSKILEVAVASYKKLFGKEPIVRSIHAGLECGLFLEKYPDMDMISFGPTLRGVHSPDEKVEIKTVEMWWNHLVDILENIK